MAAQEIFIVPATRLAFCEMNPCSQHRRCVCPQLILIPSVGFSVSMAEPRNKLLWQSARVWVKCKVDVKLEDGQDHESWLDTSREILYSMATPRPAVL